MQQSDETAGRDKTREELANAWLRHLGVDYPQELDLGTLEAIGQYVKDGCWPPSTQAP